MDVIKEVLSANSFDSFNPMQEEFLKRDWKGKNVVVSAPTASGKTLLAELSALECIVNRGKKVIYVCPLKAIASEHYSSFRKKYSKAFSVRAAISTGDLDSSSRHLAGYDIVFATYEKADSLLRHKAEWLSSVGLLVVDEVHCLGSDRGPTLEVMIAGLRMINKGMRVLALSATIPNAGEIAKWLDAELVESTYRPIELQEKIFFDGSLHDGLGLAQPVSGKESTPLETIVADTLGKKKQAIVFAATRKRSQEYALKLASLTEATLDEHSKKKLEAEADEALNALENPTEQCRLLSGLIKRGAAFHHAGLMQSQREVVEDAFKKNLVRIVCSTPTLSSGVNTPAFRVIIPSVYRYTSLGSRKIPISEYKQLCGRAGRPGYDSCGESVLFAKSETEVEELYDYYVNGSPEEVVSMLSHEPVLRVHILAAIANNFVFDLASLEDFIGRTFYYSQNQGGEILRKINPVLKSLNEMGFVEGDESRFYATSLGKRVSELYLDPLSANRIVESLKKDAAGENSLFYLYLAADTSEFFPWVRVSKEREAELWEGLFESASLLPVDVSREQYEDHNLLSKFNLCLLFSDWADEKSEEDILERFNVQPGELHSKLLIADWLIYSATELSKLAGRQVHFPSLAKLRKRLKYGVREELVPLVSVKGIGRVRARRLFRANVKTVASLKAMDITDLSRVLGEKVAIKIKEGLAGNKQ